MQQGSSPLMHNQTWAGLEGVVITQRANCHYSVRSPYQRAILLLLLLQVALKQAEAVVC
jgi:hypothetical protein